MTEVFAPNQWFRKNFSKTPTVLETPPLMRLQVNSYEDFLQKDVPPAKRKDTGLQAVFKSVFPIHDFNKTVSLEFVSYSLETPKYTVKECRQRGLSYEAPLKVIVRLVFYDVNVDKDGNEQRTVSSIKEQEVYLGNIPLMAETGSFVYNGTERVIVSQLHRSPGIIFEHDSGKKHSSGKLLYSARIIPHRGSWLDFEFDHKNVLFARIDRKRKIHATVIFKAMGYSTQEILDMFYHKETIKLDKKGNHTRALDFDLLIGTRAMEDINDKAGKPLVKKGKKFTKIATKKMTEAGIKELPITVEELVGQVVAEDLFDASTGEVLCLANEALSESKLQELMEAGIKEVKTLYIDMINFGDQVRNTLLLDKTDTKDEALIKIFERLRPGEPPTVETAESLFKSLFFDADRYDLSRVGRMKINYKFGMNTPVEETVLTKADIAMTAKYLVELNNGKGKVDDIDHLGNRRVRAVGELLENQFRVGLVRMERAVKERMAIQEIETMMPYDLVNQKPVAAAVKEFFGSSQLSQFMDQTNPLSEVTHKRRLSALGPGGLTRERAGFEVRDVHSTHYGRMCPVETPEGPNIGLITSLATYARVSEYGFIETPYQLVNEDRKLGDVKYFSAFEEETKVIAQLDLGHIKDGKVVGEHVPSRVGGDYKIVPSSEVELMDVSPSQMISVATALIPFLEHDDANRALMGSNMMRQAVPVVRTDAPIVGTGAEYVIARDSGAIINAQADGRVIFVDSNRIVIQRDKFKEGESGVDIYKLVKYQRTNQNTCNNQKALVKEGDKVHKGMVIADGPGTHLGDLALGQNILVAFMPWGGYNYEDSILINEKMLANDVFTSVHIEAFEAEARDTKLGKEEITRDIPNVSEEALKDLDEAGIIRVGAIIKPGDILVGKITPKGETQLSPEEKLLKAIFGDKAGDVKDTSLRVPSSVRGTVIDAKVYTREGVELDARSKEIIEHETSLIRRDERIEIKAIQTSSILKIAEMLKGNKTTDRLVSEDGSTELLPKDAEISSEALAKIPFELIGYIPLKPELEEKLSEYFADVRNRINRVRTKANEEIAMLHRGDELSPGVIKKVIVYVAIKRKLQPGDKMAGRHGNKGVISNVIPQEDMPFLADGTPVDIVLNPLGVPSRMNIGQLLELHLGWAGRGLGEKMKVLLEQRVQMDELKDYIFKIYNTEEVKKWLSKASDKRVREVAEQLSQGVRFSTHVFDGATEADIREMLELADLDPSGKTTLFDGKTGDAFSEEVTVGTMYMLKLHHLVDEKIHARSTGPYSLVTQQPLGGKAQFGGQRLGEMEVWALEAYGAAYTLQEFLTVKSDDVIGRTRMYESIVKGEQVLEPGLPESFNVLVRELQALCLDVKLEENSDEESLG
ncbi:MAG: DNA-directed RNA polymerase subunit beta [Bdellovibrionales bacterium CG12_big_fil_rev_8_21_14_0_65_38_15]|nr:MAG: DNA-directed RNA polymerase subunit beta [Bdellovibrionales bacterium CG22_combo_CG10-13_8_21_14_all_38_13]PIQ55417.1 MAG: DNA-directed RNA polymerase subunit beta [Bdellovibrionales bacterium CG12_big_fil_rev_8_21_14_0_65_38_15]PIR29158.1 MAG: DNA-directed RNA polymerase subunit beta [Bdellovibrionales bacterium CG11_big_fil_rev_8_21_14_0_20_38_13]